MPGAAIVALITIGTMLLLASGKVRIDVVGLLVLGSLAVTHQLPDAALFSGFSSEAVLVIAGMLAISESLVVTGITGRLGLLFMRLAGNSERRATLALMLLAAVPSGFLSDVGLVGIFTPMVTSLKKRLPKLHPTRLLLPLAIAAMLGGSLTMVGSAGNIVANQVLGTSTHQAPIGIFAITPIGLLVLAVGVGFMVLLGPILLPTAPRDTHPIWEEAGDLEQFATEFIVQPGSSLIGKRLEDIRLFHQHDCTVGRILRGGDVLPADPLCILNAGDILWVTGAGDALSHVAESGGGLTLSREVSPAISASNGPLLIAKALVVQRSRLAGQTLSQVRLSKRFGVTVLAIWRQRQPLHRRLPQTRLHVGDVLLLQGTAEPLRAFADGTGLILLEAPAEHHRVHPRSGMLAAFILGATLLAAAMNWVSLPDALCLGMLSLVAGRILPLDAAYSAVEWPVILFVAGMVPLATALQQSGLTAWLAHGLLSFGGSPRLLLGLLFISAALLTQALSNIGTVMVLAPVAVGIASALHASPVPFVLTVVMAVSTAPLTPLANKTCLLVMAPGRYQTQDFFRVGLPLAVLLGLCTVTVMPWSFPLHP